MAGTIIENMSRLKLTMIGSLALICQVICFLVGALFAPTPTSSDWHTATKCFNPAGSEVKDTWFWPRGKGACRQIEDLSSNEALAMHMNADNVVFAFQVSLRNDNDHLDFTKLHQNLIGVLMADIMFQEDELKSPQADFVLHANLAYRNKGDPENEWKELANANSSEFLTTYCTIEEENMVKGYYYNCNIMPFFILYSRHNFYLLNLRISTIYLTENKQFLKINQEIGKLVNLHLSSIHANDGFPKVWVSLMTIFFPIILIQLFWFMRRLCLLTRSTNLLEKVLISLGVALLFLNLPMEYLTLSFDIPLLNYIKQGIFNATLLTFWIIVIREFEIIDREPGESGVMDYWKSWAMALFGYLCYSAFDMCECEVYHHHPSFTIWGTELRSNQAQGFIVLAVLMMYVLICTILNSSTNFNAMSREWRLHYQEKLWRFKFLLLATLLTAAITVIGFIIGQVVKGTVRAGTYGIDPNYLWMEYKSGFMTGMYGMWNIYIFCLLFLYAPSHKNRGDDDTLSTDLCVRELTLPPHTMPSFFLTIKPYLKYVLGSIQIFCGIIIPIIFAAKSIPVSSYVLYSSGYLRSIWIAVFTVIICTFCTHKFENGTLSRASLVTNKISVIFAKIVLVMICLEAYLKYKYGC